MDCACLARTDSIFVVVIRYTGTIVNIGGLRGAEVLRMWPFGNDGTLPPNATYVYFPAQPRNRPTTQYLLYYKII